MTVRYRLAGSNFRGIAVQPVAELLTTQLGCTRVVGASPPPAGDPVLANGTATIHVSANSGPGRITALVVAVDRFDAAPADLARRGVTATPRPDGTLSVVDPDGLVTVVRPDDTSSIGTREIGPHLHHVSITTDQLMRSSEFYERAFGLAVAYDYAEPDEPAKLRFLADPQFVNGGHEFLLELMGPPFLLREAAVFHRWGGACFDHYCFTTGEPVELHATCLAAGCRSSEEPVFVEGFDLTLSYLFGPDDVEIELMDPPGADTIALPS
ncbi:MAG: hypothetical protein R2705_05055 [Ilumatobacteraceae bacterium]